MNFVLIRLVVFAIVVRIVMSGNHDGSGQFVNCPGPGKEFIVSELFFLFSIGDNMMICVGSFQSIPFFSIQVDSSCRNKNHIYP
jgi:hypothetical protein